MASYYACQQTGAFAQRKTKFSYAPKFSVVVPLYHTPAKFLKDLVRSMMYQSYANWELCLVNASPEDVHLTSLLENWAMRDKRIRVIRLEKNLGIAQNTNAGIAASTGEFIAFWIMMTFGARCTILLRRCTK